MKSGDVFDQEFKLGGIKEVLCTCKSQPRIIYSQFNAYQVFVDRIY